MIIVSNNSYKEHSQPSKNEHNLIRHVSQIRSTAPSGCFSCHSTGLGTPRSIQDSDQGPYNDARGQYQEPDQRRDKPDQVLHQGVVGSEEDEVCNLEREAAEEVDSDDHVRDDAVEDAAQQPPTGHGRADDHAKDEDRDESRFEDGEYVPRGQSPDHARIPDRFDHSTSRPAHLLPDPGRERVGRVGVDNGVWHVVNVVAGPEEARREVSVLVRDLYNPKSKVLAMWPRESRPNGY